MPKKRKKQSITTVVVTEILIQLKQQLDVISPDLGSSEVLNIPDAYIKVMLNQVRLPARHRKRIFNTIKELFMAAKP